MKFSWKSTPGAAVVLLVLATPGLAATVYDINFTRTSGTTTPTSGSFTYDPLTGFSNFLVVWDGFTIDYSSGANHPPRPLPGAIPKRRLRHMDSLS